MACEAKIRADNFAAVTRLKEILHTLSFGRNVAGKAKLENAVLTCVARIGPGTVTRPYIHEGICPRLASSVHNFDPKSQRNSSLIFSDVTSKQSLVQVVGPFFKFWCQAAQRIRFRRGSLPYKKPLDDRDGWTSLRPMSTQIQLRRRYTTSEGLAWQRTYRRKV